MKRFLVALCSLFLLTSFGADAQGVIRFEEVSSAPYNLHTSFSKYRILALTDSPETLADGEPLTVRTGSGKFSFTLRDSRLFAPNYIVSVRGPHGVERRGLQEIGFDGAYFTSDVLSATEALVLSVFDNQYSIFLKQRGAEWYAEPLSSYIPSAPRHLYVQYRAKDVAAMDARCGNAPLASGSQQNLPTGGPEAGACFNTELAIGCDYSLFQEYGSIAATINRTATITNFTRADYKINNGLLDDIGFQIVEHYVITCDTCNPWAVASTINTHLTNVRLNGPTIFLNTYDLAQWWFNDPAFGGGTVGLAYVGAVCGAYRYNAVMDFTANTNSMRCTNSHEIGHNFNCGHDASGSISIMAPSVSGSTAWSSQSVSQIGAYVPTTACLATCPTTLALCDTQGVHNLAIRKDTVASTVTVKWVAPAGTSFRARLYNFSTASWTGFTTVAAPTDSIVFSIPTAQCGGKFKADVMPACSGPVYGGRKQVVFNWRRSIPLAANITASPAGAVCTGTPVTYTAATNATSGITYQWKLNGVNVGTNAPSYATAPANGAVVTLIASVTGTTCHTGSPATSNAITAVTTTSVTSMVGIASSPAGTVCASQNVTFTATPLTGGTSPSYQWKKNGVNVGTNSATYTGTGWTAGDAVSVVMSSNASCVSPASATSNAIVMSVNAPATPVITAVATPATACTGQLYTLTATPFIPGATFQWFNNSTALGSGASISLTNAAAASYAHHAVATLPAGGCYTSPTVTSDTVTATVTAPTTPTASVSATAATVCAGTPVTFAAFTNVAGGAWQWQVNGTAAGTGAATFTYTPQHGDAVRVVVTPPAGGCYSAATAVSTPVTMTVNPLVPPTAFLSGDTTLCGMQSTTYTASTAITGAAWAWTLNGAPVAASGNSYAYAPANGDVLAVTATAASGCYVPASATTSLSMDVATPQAYSVSLSPSTSAGPGAGTMVTYNAAVAGVMPYVIRWYNFGTHVFSSTIPQWAHMIPAGGRDSVWAWVSPVGQAGCFAADSVRSNVLLVDAAPTGLAAAPTRGGFTVYPNPVRETIFISGLKRGDEIRVLNSLGQVVAQRVATAASAEIDARRWAAGMYLVQVGNVVVRVVHE